MSPPPVALGVDVGGTFTDVVLFAGGELTTVKVATTAPDQSRGVLRGVELACRSAAVDPGDVDRFRHATTVATNALLEGTGASTALVTTAGFGDVIAIGRQDRLELYDPTAQKADPLVAPERRFEVAERATPAGIETAVDTDAVTELVDRLESAVDPADGDPVEAIAVSFLHAYAAPENERRVADRLRETLDVPVSVSHEVLGTFREYERTATTVADAMVTPVIDRYLGRLVEEATDRGLPAPWVMSANGGIADVEAVGDRAVTTALSGPAAGVVGARAFTPSDRPGVVSFDMGGTSCDVGLVRDGDVAETTEASLAGHPVHVPMVDVETVGAGGGSIAWIDDGGALRVGPESAGAEPGPACYGLGGSDPTVTDAAVVLGYLGPGASLGQDVEVAADLAEAVLTELATAAELPNRMAAAEGVYEVANARMARAIRTVTVERGHDPRDLALVAFGGAGPMHAAAIADRLDIGTVVVPRANGVLSALGLLRADERHDAMRTYRTTLDGADVGALEAAFEELATEVRSTGETGAELTLDRSAACRYAGQSYELVVPVDEPVDPDALAERFHAVHHRERGFAPAEETVELVTLRVRGTRQTAGIAVEHEGDGDPRRGARTAVFDGEAVETPVFDREGLSDDARLDGPAICEGGESTVVVPPGWAGRIDGRGSLVLEAAG